MPVHGVLERVCLSVEIGNDLAALPDLSAAISEIQIVAGWVRSKGVDRKSEIRVVEMIREDGLGDGPDIFVADVIGEYVAVGEKPLEGAVTGTGRPVRKALERQA